MTQDVTDLQTLLVLAVDERVDFCRELAGNRDEPTAADRERAAGLKRVVFDGLASAIEQGLPKSQAAVLTDADLGEGVLLRARAMSLAAAFAVDGSDEAGLASTVTDEGWTRFQRMGASFLAVRTDYDPTAALADREQSQRLLRSLSTKSREESTKFLLELAPPVEEDGPEERLAVLFESMRQLQDAGVEPAVWAFQPPSDARSAAAVTAQAHVDDRSGVTVLFTTGEGKAAEQISVDVSRGERAVARLAARTAGAGGLLVGPEAYFGQLALLTQEKAERTDVVAGISTHIRTLWDVFSDARKTSNVT